MAYKKKPKKQIRKSSSKRDQKIIDSINQKLEMLHWTRLYHDAVVENITLRNNNR